MKLRAEGVLFTQEPGFASTRLVAADLKSFEAAKKILVDLKVSFFTYAANPPDFEADPHRLLG